MKNLLWIVSVLTLLTAGLPARAEAIVVVSNAPGTLNVEELRAIYFQNGGRLSNGQVVTPLDYKENSAEREEFYQRAFGRSKTQMKAYWAQRIFTGKGSPPQSVDNAKEAISLTAKKANTYISYINESELSPGLNILLRLP